MTPFAVMSADDRTRKAKRTLDLSRRVDFAITVSTVITLERHDNDLLEVRDTRQKQSRCSLPIS